MNQRLLLVAVVFPILGLLALIGRAELNLRNGRGWDLPISGYDPRDLLSGHYLRYQYRLEWQPDASTCGDGESIDRSCCLCLQPRQGSREPLVSSVRCDAVAGCLSWLRGSDVAGEQRYFIPAERAAELEQALRTRPAALRVSITADATLAVDTLLLDGVPWQRERVGSAK
jgi:hypothetical protein